jgi:3-hydroxyacyl-[acyl-carrier-protein] dehydratase
MTTEQKFLDDLYFIKSSQTESVNKLTVKVEIKREHPIFTGHFPGNPILPGVCTIQILKELVAEHLGKKVSLLKAVNIKYLSFINPDMTNLIDFNIELKEMENGYLSCNTTINHENTIFCTFKGEFKTEENLATDLHQV